MSRDVTCGSAEDQLTKPRVPIGAHHQEIGIKISRTRKYFVANTDLGGNRGAQLWLEPVTGQGRGDGCVRSKRACVICPFFDFQDVDDFSPQQQWKRIEYRTRRLACRLPGDNNTAPNRGIAPGIGNNQHGPAALQRQMLRKIQHRRQIPFRVGLAGHDKIRGTSTPHHLSCQVEMRNLLQLPFGDVGLAAGHVLENVRNGLAVSPLGSNNCSQ